MGEVRRLGGGIGAYRSDAHRCLGTPLPDDEPFPVHSADVAPEMTDLPLWAVIVVGAGSGLIGAVVGPTLQCLFARGDRALDARRDWGREKLQTAV